MQASLLWLRTALKTASHASSCATSHLVKESGLAGSLSRPFLAHPQHALLATTPSCSPVAHSLLSSHTRSAFHTSAPQQSWKENKGKYVDHETVQDRIIIPPRSVLRRGGMLTPEAVVKPQDTSRKQRNRDGTEKTRWVRDPDSITPHKGLFEYAGQQRLYRLPRRGDPVNPKNPEIWIKSHGRNQWRRFAKKQIFIEQERFIAREQRWAAAERKVKKKQAEQIALEHARLKWEEYLAERANAGVFPVATIEYNRRLADYRGMFQDNPRALGLEEEPENRAPDTA